MRKITKETMYRMGTLSHEWNNTGFAVLNKDGTIVATVWNKYKWEKDTPEERKIVASCNGNDGWEIIDNNYEFEVSPNSLNF